MRWLLIFYVFSDGDIVTESQGHYVTESLCHDAAEEIIVRDYALYPDPVAESEYHNPHPRRRELVFKCSYE